MKLWLKTSHTRVYRISNIKFIIDNLGSEWIIIFDTRHNNNFHILEQVCCNHTGIVVGCQLPYGKLEFWKSKCPLRTFHITQQKNRVPSHIHKKQETGFFQFGSPNGFGVVKHSYEHGGMSCQIIRVSTEGSSIIISNTKRNNILSFLLFAYSISEKNCKFFTFLLYCVPLPIVVVRLHSCFSHKSFLLV